MDENQLLPKTIRNFSHIYNQQMISLKVIYHDTQLKASDTSNTLGMSDGDLVHGDAFSFSG